MRAGELARPVIGYERREAIAIFQDTPQHGRRLSRRQMLLNHGLESGEVDERRLAIAPVVPVSGMLRHVCGDDDTMRRWISEPEGLVGLYLPRELPAAGGTRDLLVHGPGHVGHSRPHCGHGTVRRAI